MTAIKCCRCQQDKKALKEAPFDNELGKKLLQQTCVECWQGWVGQQLMLMNEYRLDPLNEEHSKFLDEEMQKFLSLK